MKYWQEFVFGIAAIVLIVLGVWKGVELGRYVGDHLQIVWEP